MPDVNHSAVLIIARDTPGELGDKAAYFPDFRRGHDEARIEAVRTETSADGGRAA
jgi:hypothetical protein